MSDESQFKSRIGELRSQIHALSKEHVSLRDAVVEAEKILSDLEEQRNSYLAVNHHLAEVSAESAKLMAELEEKNRVLEESNRSLSKANAYASELMGELETRNEKINVLNKTLSIANATAAELVAELDCQREELEELNRSLNEANEEKSHILGVIAHDLRSGIGGIGGIALLISDECSEEESETKQYIELIKQESKRLLDLLTSLLDMSRLEQGRLELNRIPFDINTVVMESISYHKRFADAKGQKIINDLAGKPLFSAIDPVRIRQVCDNLLFNAVKYSKYDSDIKVSTYLLGKDVVAEFTDSGPGLKDEDKKKLFKGFQKLSTQPTGGEDSHGLGLLIAKKVIATHHGRIWMEDRKDGEGAVFCFSLPSRMENPYDDE